MTVSQEGGGQYLFIMHGMFKNTQRWIYQFSFSYLAIGTGRRNLGGSERITHVGVAKDIQPSDGMGSKSMGAMLIFILLSPGVL